MAIFDIIIDEWDNSLEYWDGNQPVPINLNDKKSQATIDIPTVLKTVSTISNISTD